jgi:hypothetical protein
LRHIPAKYNDPVTFARALMAAEPDWLIVDIPHTPPDWIRGLAKCRICTLNGIGYNQNDGANLRVIQGVADVDLPGPQDKVPVLKGLEYVILRPEIEKYKGMVKGTDLMVWGGGADPLNLLQRFNLACPGKFATLIVSPMAPAPVIIGPCHATIRLNEESTDIFEWMGGSRGLVCAMGMICMEAAYLKLPQWVFSFSPLHLRFARGLERLGLIKMWPEVGLPSNEEIRAFVEEDFEPWGEPPSLDGAVNVMKAIEDFG